MFQTTVTIGRNERHGNFQLEMTDARWQEFQNDGRLTLMRVTGAPVEVHLGRGEWDGVAEDSAKLSVLTEEALSDKDVYTLRNRFLSLKFPYLQDAIAISFNAPSELV